MCPSASSATACGWSIRDRRRTGAASPGTHTPSSRSSAATPSPASRSSTIAAEAPPAGGPDSRIIDAMRLPFAPPLAPMLSTAAMALPDGDGWQFEPKWDGFRTLVFRDGAEILLQSRDEKPMNRYFPELMDPLAAALP